MSRTKNLRVLTILVWITAACLCVFLLIAASGLLALQRAGAKAIARREATPPIVSFLSPAHGAQIGLGAAVPVHVQATSADEPLVRLQLWADGQLIGDMPAMSTSAQAVWFWVSRTPGDHTLTAWAYTRPGGSANTSIRVQALQAPDRDGDGVPDEQDACPDEAGLIPAQGCPTASATDRDGDGIADSQDRCPDQFGLGEHQGCPQPADGDGDGLPNNVDASPDQAGPLESQGSPDPGAGDQDGDSVPDDQDQCDDQPGAGGSLGCPGQSDDRDNDGVLNDQDQCGDVAGPEENAGCPLVDADDQDGDGNVDDQDDCPLWPGGEDDGCPVAGNDPQFPVPDWADGLFCALARLGGGELPPFCNDSDDDGLTDADDRCPQEAGPAIWGGCSSPAGQGIAIINGGLSPLWCSIAPAACTDSDNDGFMDNEDGCPDSPGDILGCRGSLEPGGVAVGLPVDVEIRLGERLYTNRDWHGVYCYAEVEGVPSARLPVDDQYLDREASSVWKLGDRQHRSLHLTTEEMVLSLSIECYGMPDLVGPPVSLGRITRHHPRDDWSGTALEATSEGANHTFTLYYQICRDSCP